MCWGKLRAGYNKIKSFFLPENSKEYQRMLAGIRVYFSMMKQRSFMNFLIVIILMFFFLLFIVVWSNFQKGTESIISIVYDSLYFASLFIILMLYNVFIFNLLEL